jgi:ketosteroid isomerase-like protein
VVSSRNLETLRQQFDHWNNGDLDSMLAPYARTLYSRRTPAFRGGTFEGRGAIRRFFEGLQEGRSAVSGIPTDFRQGAGRVLVAAEWRATGEVTGIQTGSDWSVLYVLREVRINRVRFFYERGEALAAAGLAPEGDTPH